MLAALAHKHAEGQKGRLAHRQLLQWDAAVLGLGGQHLLLSTVNPEPCPALYCPVLPLQDSAYLAEWTYGTDLQFLCLGSR